MGNLVFQATLGGQVNLVGPNTASTFNINVPAAAGTMVVTGSSPTFTQVTAPTIGAASGASLAIQSNGTTNATLDTSGNLGLGVTPSAWVNSATRKAIQLPAVGQVAASGTMVVYSNSYYNGTNDVYTTTGAAGVYTIAGNVHSWGQQASGTAGTTLNFSTAMTLDASGNLLVGTTSPLFSQTSRIQVLASSASAGGIAGIQPNSATSASFSSQSVTTAGTGWFHFIGQSGNGSSITANNIFIFGNGNIQNTNNSYGAISDIKLKENVTDATPKLQNLCKVRVVNYNLIGDYENHKQLGVIAQELEQIFPGMVEETFDRDVEGNDLGTTTKSVKYSVFVPMLIKAIQEQQVIITQLQADVAALKAPQ